LVVSWLEVEQCGGGENGDLRRDVKFEGGIRDDYILRNTKEYLMNVCFEEESEGALTFQGKAFSRDLAKVRCVWGFQRVEYHIGLRIRSVYIERYVV